MILNRLRQEIWSVVACILNNSVSVRLKHSRWQKLVGTRDRRIVCDCFDCGQISVQISSWRIHCDESARLEDRPTTARWRCARVCGPRDWGTESKSYDCLGSGNVRPMRFRVCSYCLQLVNLSGRVLAGYKCAKMDHTKHLLSPWFLMLTTACLFSIHCGVETKEPAPNGLKFTNEALSLSIRAKT